MRHYMRWLYGACEQVLVPSRDTCARLVADRWNAERMSVWPRGVDTVMFSPSRRSAALREQWHVCDRRPAVLYAGRVSREKGLALLRPLETLLHQRRVPFRLVIVGEGPMTAELRALCPDAVFTGRLSHDQVAVAMASADAFVFPSETDTAGNVVLEAQASGLPVIVTSAGGPQENMRHGETGFVCAPKDAHGVAQRLAELLRDDGYRTGVGAAARRYAAGAELGRVAAARVRPVPHGHPDAGCSRRRAVGAVASARRTVGRMMPMAPTLGEVLRDIARHPIRHLVVRWNWKSAALSCWCGGGDFPAGQPARRRWARACARCSPSSPSAP